MNIEESIWYETSIYKSQIAEKINLDIFNNSHGSIIFEKLCKLISLLPDMLSIDFMYTLFRYIEHDHINDNIESKCHKVLNYGWNSLFVPSVDTFCYMLIALLQRQDDQALDFYHTIFKKYYTVHHITPTLLSDIIIKN